MGQKKTKEEIESIETLQAERDLYLANWKQAHADYLNTKARETHNRNEITVRTKIDCIERLLPAIDSFDQAFANSDAWEKVDQNWRVGVEYIYQQLIAALTEMGVEVIEPIEEQFDPKFHESVETVPVTDDIEPHTVVAVLQKGYKIDDYIIRAARVKVAEQS